MKPMMPFNWQKQKKGLLFLVVLLTLLHHTCNIQAPHVVVIHLQGLKKLDMFQKGIRIIYPLKGSQMPLLPKLEGLVIIL